MNISIIGPSPLSTYLAIKLSINTNHEIALFDSNICDLKKKNSLEALYQNGDDCDTTDNVKVYNEFDDLPKAEVIVFSTKASQNDRMIDRLDRMCSEQASIILLQNGLGIEDSIAEEAPGYDIYSGACWIKVIPLDFSRVRHEFGNTIKIGRYSPFSSHVEPNNKDEKIKSIFDLAGMRTELVMNIKAVQMTKLALNVPFYMVASDRKMSFTEILHDSSADKERIYLQDELITAISKIDYSVDLDLINEMTRDLRNLPVEAPDSREQFSEVMKNELKITLKPLVAMLKNSNIEIEFA